MSLVRVRVDETGGELAADALWQAGATAVEERDGELLAGFPSAATAAAAVGALAGQWEASLAVEGSDDEWLDAWRPWASAARAGRRIVVQPAWVEPIAAPGDLVVELDPGHAFGSGSHPSTRLALAALEEVVTPGCTVLDVGCGSGVLSVAAVLLGAAAVTAIDIDDRAVAAAVDNATRNRTGDRVHASTTPLVEMGGTYDVIVANIGQTPLIRMAADIERRLAPGGSVVLSGLLGEQWREVTAAYPGLRVTGVADEEGWSAVVLEARAAPVVE